MHKPDFWSNIFAILIVIGKVVSGWKVSDNKNWNLIGKRSPQLPQMFYPISDSELTLTKGDIVAARCTMVSNEYPFYLIDFFWKAYFTCTLGKNNSEMPDNKNFP